MWVLEWDRRRSALFSPVRRNWSEFNGRVSPPLGSTSRESADHRWLLEAAYLLYLFFAIFNIG